MNRVSLARYSSDPQRAWTLQNIEVYHLPVFENAQIDGFAKTKKEILHDAFRNRLQSAKMDHWPGQLKKLGCQLVVRFEFVLLYVSEFFQRIQNSVHGRSGQGNSTRQIGKSNRFSRSAYLNKMFQDSEDLAHHLDVVFVRLHAQ